MIHKTFSIFDSKASAYLPPFYMQTKAEAIRAIGDCVDDKEHRFAKHPEDYTLFYLGEFDDNKGTFEDERGISADGTWLKL